MISVFSAVDVIANNGVAAITLIALSLMSLAALTVIISWSIDAIFYGRNKKTTGDIKKMERTISKMDFGQREIAAQKRYNARKGLS